MKNLIYIILFCSFSSMVLAQQTGEYEENADFTETDDYPYVRTLAWYVPLDYNPNKSYRLIVGFRGGPHATTTSFRDQLIVMSDTMDAIILCPNNLPHFNNKEKEVALLFNHAVDIALERYNVDTNYIYIAGLSYGGRHTVITSLSSDRSIHPIRGILTFATGTNTENIPDYTSSNLFPPVCINSGTNDSQHFIDISHRFHEMIQNNGGKSLLNILPNVGHTTAFDGFQKEFLHCVSFIEDQYVATQNIEYMSIHDIMIFPNPTTDHINIRLQNKNIEIQSIILKSMDAKIIQLFDKDLKTIQVPEVMHGYYLLEFETNKGVMIKKLFIE